MSADATATTATQPPLALLDVRSTPPVAAKLARYVLTHGTPSDARLVLRIGQRLLAGDSATTVPPTARALASLDAFWTDQRVRPTKVLYGIWHSVLPDARMWCSPDEIAQALGGWDRVPKVWEGKLKPRPMKRRRLAQGSKFTDDELRAAGRLFASERPNDCFCSDAYLAWADDYYARGCPAGIRVPCSLSPFTRLMPSDSGPEGRTW